MALPEPTNCTVDIYRTFFPKSPYPKTDQVAAITQLPGIIKHHVKNGRFGYKALNLHWTHVLWLPPTTDVRDFYGSQLDQSVDIGKADTVTITDYPLVGWCTAFVVVFVQLVGRGTAFEFYKVYLDRLQPVNRPCKQGTVQVGTVKSVCCPNTFLPVNISATVKNITACAILDGLVIPLKYQGSSYLDTWSGQVTIPGSAQNGLPSQSLYAIWQCGPYQNYGLFFTFTSLWIISNAPVVPFDQQLAFIKPGQYPDMPTSCDPLNMVWSNMDWQVDHYFPPTPESPCCTGRITITVTPAP